MVVDVVVRQASEPARSLGRRAASPGWLLGGVELVVGRNWRHGSGGGGGAGLLIAVERRQTSAAVLAKLKRRHRRRRRRPARTQVNEINDRFNGSQMGAPLASQPASQRRRRRRWSF